MKVFNLYGDDWDETRDRDGWRMKEAFVGHHIGGGLIGASMSEVEPGTGKVFATNHNGEPIMFSKRGPTSDYWEGED